MASDGQRVSEGRELSSETAAELRALADRYRLAPDASAKLGRLYELLISDRSSPTAIREPSRVLDDHLADSLVALEIEQVRAATRAADVGAGAGLPGLALASALPALHVTLIESTRRKCDFIARTIGTCGLQNASVICERVESWRDGRGQMDLATARALAQLPVVIEYAAPLLRIGGVLVAWRGKRDDQADRAGAYAAERLGLERVELRPVQPFSGARHRHLDVMLKVRETPTEFPRRPGVAAKRPLGAE